MLCRISVLALFGAAAFAQDGAAVYKERCAACHETGANRAPTPAGLKQMTPEAVETSLLTGSMALVAMGLPSPQVKAVATFVTGKPLGTQSGGGSGECESPAGAESTPLHRVDWYVVDSSGV